MNLKGWNTARKWAVECPQCHARQFLEIQMEQPVSKLAGCAGNPPRSLRSGLPPVVPTTWDRSCSYEQELKVVWE